jgi:hypothetical protein
MTSEHTEASSTTTAATTATTADTAAAPVGVPSAAAAATSPAANAQVVHLTVARLGCKPFTVGVMCGGTVRDIKDAIHNQEGFRNNDQLLRVTLHGVEEDLSDDDQTLDALGLGDGSHVALLIDEGSEADDDSEDDDGEDDASFVVGDDVVEVEPDVEAEADGKRKALDVDDGIDTSNILTTKRRRTAPARYVPAGILEIMYSTEEERALLRRVTGGAVARHAAGAPAPAAAAEADAGESDDEDDEDDEDDDDSAGANNSDSEYETAEEEDAETGVSEDDDDDDDDDDDADDDDADDDDDASATGARKTTTSPVQDNADGCSSTVSSSSEESDGDSD